MQGPSPMASCDVPQQANTSKRHRCSCHSSARFSSTTWLQAVRGIYSCSIMQNTPDKISRVHKHGLVTVYRCTWTTPPPGFPPTECLALTLAIVVLVRVVAESFQIFSMFDIWEALGTYYYCTSAEPLPISL